MPANPELRRAVLRLAAGIVAVDTVFIAIWSLARIGARPDRQRMIFVALWTIATLAVVLPGLTAVRRVRARLRRGRATPG